MQTGTVVFGYSVQNPHQFGIVELDKSNHILSLEEKPLNLKSNLAVPRLYFYDNQVVDMVKEVKSSARGELEITTINQMYLQKQQLSVLQWGRGITTKRFFYVIMAAGMIA